MIRGFVEYALKNRFIIMMVTVLLLLWGAISFHNLPVEAYPDVANNYVQIITQWPGRAAEEVEPAVVGGSLLMRAGARTKEVYAVHRSLDRTGQPIVGT